MERGDDNAEGDRKERPSSGVNESEKEVIATGSESSDQKRAGKGAGVRESEVSRPPVAGKASSHIPPATNSSSTGGAYQERVLDELRRREVELARLDREIDRLMHWLEKARPKRRPFIGLAGLLSSQGNFVKELRDRLTKKRIARASMLIEVTRARERMQNEE